MTVSSLNRRAASAFAQIARCVSATLALAALALGGAVGCGGSARLTRSELVARADAICRGVAERRDRAYIKSPEQYASVWPPLVAFERSQFDRLAKLVPPLPMTEEWQQLLAVDRRAADDRAKAARDETSGRLDIVRRDLAALMSEEQQAAGIGASDGFRYCSLVET